jgi:hypothetical protein
MKKTTLKNLVRNIQTKDLYTARFTILAPFSDMMLAGRPDAIVFVRRSPAFIIELKTTVVIFPVFEGMKRFRRGFTG